jgi:hypothetical protein
MEKQEQNCSIPVVVAGFEQVGQLLLNTSKLRGYFSSRTHERLFLSLHQEGKGRD